MRITGVIAGSFVCQEDLVPLDHDDAFFGIFNNLPKQISICLKDIFWRISIWFHPYASTLCLTFYPPLTFLETAPLLAPI